jgi:TolA-binding protein
MNCKSAGHFIDEFIDGYCDAEKASQIKEHLDSCIICTDAYDSQLQIRSAMRSFSVPSKTDQQWLSLEKSILSEIEHISPQIKTIPFKPAGLMQWRVAAVFILFLLGSIPFVYNGLKEWEKSNSFAGAPKVISIEGSVALNGSVCADQHKLPEVKVGEMIATNIKSSVTIKADSGSNLTVSEKSAISLKSFSRKNQTFQLDYGKVAVQVAKRQKDQLFSVKTRNAVCEVVGTKFSVEFAGDSSSQTTLLKVLEGCVRFRTLDGNAVLVNSGEQCSINGGLIGRKVAAPSNDSILENGNKKTFEDIVRRGDKKLINELKPTENDNYLSAAEYISYISGADTLIEKNDYTGALQVVDRIISTSPLKSDQRYDASMKKARILKSLKQYTNVAAVFENVANGNFRNEYKGNALYQYAMLQKNELKNVNKSIEALKKYISLHTDGLMISDAYYSLAEILHEKKDYSGEASVYTKYIEAFGSAESNQRAVYALAKLYSSELHDCSRALGLFTHLADTYPKGPYTEDALFWKANCLHVQGMAIQAIRAYKEYLEKYPTGRWSMDAKARTTAINDAGDKR